MDHVVTRPVELNVTKYPPSLLFALVTLGPIFLLLPAMERLGGFAGEVLATFGRVPLFIYLLHLYAARAAAVVLWLAEGFGFQQLRGFGILALEPDLVLTFSDLQAPIAAELIRAGVAVHAFNQRDIAGILAMIRTVGALVGALDKAEGLARSYEARLGEVAALVRGRPKPKVYFEEWDDPLISGIGWVSELIEIAGGDEVFPELRKQKAAKDRIVSPHDVIAAAPHIILASWCGKKVVPDAIRQRSGWGAIPAVRNGRIVEIKSALILQPGPAALTDGLDAILAALGQRK